MKRTLGIVAAVLVGGYLVLRWALSDARTSSDFVLVVTALIVAWYTLETAELRKLGARRETLEARPLLAFNLEQRDRFSMWLPVRNFTRNPALIRVLVRLKTSAGVGRFGNGPYSAHADWQIAPVQEFKGWFSLLDLMAAIQDEAWRIWGQQLVGKTPRVTWPAKPEMQLDVQVAVYDSERRFVHFQRQEYAIRWASQDAEIQWWPEIEPKALPPVPWPALLPEGKLDV